MKKSKSVGPLIYDLLLGLGEDPKRQGLSRTPKRVEASFRFLTKGYSEDPKAVLNGAIFDEEYDEMVVLKDLDIYSLCEHHLLPFHGKCHVAYIPKGKIIGLSKIPRIVDIFARRLQVQERLTHEIANCLMEALKPLGVAVIIEALHLCMAMRGVQKQSANCVTSAMFGVFRTDRATRSEFFDIIHRKSTAC